MAERSLCQEALSKKSEQVITFLRARGDRLVTAESCTGGLIAAILTTLPGASDIIEGGLVTYSNSMKSAVLNVAEKTLQHHGAVSETTAIEMAMGALDCAENATIAVSVTGIAGPGGGSEGKPVGTVCLCLLEGSKAPIVETMQFYGDRDTIRYASVSRIFDLILTRL